MLTIAGFATIILVVVILIRGKVIPIVPLVLVPVAAAFIVGFNVEDITDFFDDGVAEVIDVAIMFIFAILYFGIMQSAGLFDPLIKKVIELTNGNIVTISMGTVIIAAVAQLDGSGASTFLITIPALLPLYQQLKMNPYLLLLLIGGSASVMNMLPWAGPVGRAASVLDMDVTELWRPLIPIQIIGLVLMLGLAALVGFLEKRRIERRYGRVSGDVQELAEKEADRHPSSVKLLWFNFILTLLVVGVLVWGVLPSGLIFMIGVSIALPINYRSSNDQDDTVKTHAHSALKMATIILAAGSFLGILTGTGMLESMAEDTVKVIPEFMTSYIHLIIGFFGILFELLLSTDAYYFALLPVVEQIGNTFGIGSLAITYALIVGNIVGTFISPFSPAVWLALGLAGLEIGKHIRYSLFWLWGVSIVLLIVGYFFGLFSG